MLTTLATAIAFGGAGYYLRDRQANADTTTLKFPPKAPVAPPKQSPGPSQVEAPPQPAPPVKPPQPVPQPGPTTPPQPVKLDFDGTLKAFLEAPDWKTRSQYVIIPEQVRDLMEARAKESGDGPIAVTSVAVAFIDKDGNHIYSVCTKSMPEGIPASVLATDEGPKVDWEAFAAFHDDDFRKFYQGPVGSSGIFYVFLRPEPPATGEEESYFMRFRISVPMPNREQVAWVAKKSTVAPVLKRILAGEGTLNQEQVKEQLSRKGIPMVLGLEKKANGTGKDFLEITEFKALGWGPRPE